MSKVSRNDPCPCGSGKKYKKCCGPLEEARAKKKLLSAKPMPTLFSGAASPPQNLAKKVFKILTKPVVEEPKPQEEKPEGTVSEPVEQPKSYGTLEELLGAESSSNG